MILKRDRKILLFVSAIILSLSAVFSLVFSGDSAYAVDQPTYGEITTSVESDTTLQYVAGKEATSAVSFETKTSGMPDENDGTPVTNGYAVFIHPLYCAVTNNAIVFDTPISKEDMEKSGGLTIRMYAELSAGKSFMVIGRPSDFAYGIYFYGLGATGGFEDHGVWVPADIKQNEYIDFKINAYDASRLADSEGMVRGLVLGSNINRNEAGAVTDEDFYVTNPDPYLYIKSISLNAPDTSEISYGEVKTYSGNGGLTHVNGYAKDGDNGSYSKYYEGMSPVDIVPGYRSYEPINELPQDNGQTVEKAYRFTYHFSSVATVAKNSVLFERPLTVSEIEKSGGMKLRIYAHLTSDGSEYTRFNDTYGLFFYGYGEGITGESDDTGVLIPENVVQDEWTDLIIPAETLKLMAGDDGVLYGLNYGSRIDVVSEAMYKGNTATNPGYVLLSKVTLLEKDIEQNSVTFKVGSETVKSYSADNGSTIVLEDIPVSEGNVFVGWVTENGLYFADTEFTVTGDVTFNALFVSFGMEKGAGIRISEPTGLRFAVKLNESEYESIKTLVGEDNVNLGVKVDREDGKSLEIKVTNTLVRGENLCFNGVIKNMTADYYNVEYTGIGFIDITYSDSETRRIYAVANDNTRTIAEVALAAYNDSEAGYSEEQLAVLRVFFETAEV